MTIQNGNSWRAYFNIVEEIVKELFGDSVRPRTQIIRFLLPIVLAFGITSLFLCLVLRDLLQVHSVDGQEPSIVVFRWLERLPATSNFYYFIAALAGTYMGKRWCSYADLRSKFAARRQNDDECDLTSRDWWVVQELRKRAFFLRTRAVWILGGIFLLLVTGVYFTIFILPRVGGSDESIRREIRQQQCKNEIGNIGLHWFKMLSIPDDLRANIDESREEADKGRVEADSSFDISMIKIEHEEENSTLELDAPLERGEGITAAAFSADGRIGVVAGDEGSVFLTTDGGESWGPLNLTLEGGEWIIAAALSADGRIGMVAGDKGSVFLTTDGGESWGPLNLTLEGGERIIAAALSADTQIMIYHITSAVDLRVADGDWENFDVPIGREWITAAALSADGRIWAVAGSEGSVFLTTDGRKSWRSLDLPLNEREWITAATFSADGGIGVLVGDEGSVFRTADGGENWGSSRLQLKRTEWITAAALSADGRIGVLVGNESSVFRTANGGESWEPTKLEDSISPERVFALKREDNVLERKDDVLSDVTFVLEADDGVQYFLRSQEELNDWSDMSPTAIRDTMKDDAILRNSSVFQNIDDCLYGHRLVDAETGEDNEGGFVILDNLTVMRMVTLVSLLILVHILVRLHRYSVRLAAFWDARADAVLLAQSFARCKAETFDDLAAVFAPDAYDFKPAPRLGHESATKLLRHVRRGESRTS